MPGRAYSTDYSSVFRRFAKSRILVVGDLILDHYIWGVVERISPEAPVPVVDVVEENFAMGGAANVAANIAALGGQALIAGVIGKDRQGEILTELLATRGIDASGLIPSGKPTTVKSRVIAHNQQVVRFDREDKNRLSERALAKLLDYISSCRDSLDAVIISDYKKGVICEKLMQVIVKEFRTRGVFVAVDPKVGHFDLYRRVSLITPNTKEAAEGSGVEIRDEKTLLRAGEKLLKRLHCDAVLITRGEHGMSLFQKDSVTHIPTFAKSVFDVTGAGDSVISTFTLAHAAGAGLPASAVLSNHAAGIVVGQVGTATVSVDEIKQQLLDASGEREHPGGTR